MVNYIELSLSGLEPPLSEMERAVQDTTHRFAKEILRPAGVEIDAMSPGEAVALGSPLWNVLEQVAELGLGASEMADLEPLERARISAIAGEELAWGDSGLAATVLVAQMPALFSMIAGNTEMAEYCQDKLGCWALTEPDHGSDMVDADGSLQAPTGKYGRPNCVARIEDDKIVINGQKSAWISGAITAQVCALFCHVEEGGSTRPGVAVIVPLDAAGVSRGKPLDKIGLRALNQGELYFDSVEVPLSHLIAEPDGYTDLAYQCLAEANAHVGNLFVGVARAAYEHALTYAHERKQGGVSIIQHQSVRSRIFHMFRKVEAARALVRRVLEYNATAPVAALQGSMAAKITGTQTAFEVASEAIQIFGGNGLTKEFPVEKLLRDGRAGLIADGCNEILAIKGGGLLTNPDLL